MATHSSILSWIIRGTGGWWAAIYGVAQSQTQLTWLSRKEYFIFLPGKGGLCFSELCTHPGEFQFSSLAQLCLTLWPHESQHARPPCPSLTPGVYPNSCPLSRWCHPAISSSVVPVPPSFSLSQHQVFSNESAVCIRWPRYWSFSFSISPSNEYSGLISFRMD